jgi:hypothetical protein
MKSSIIFLFILICLGLSANGQLKINFVLYDGLDESVTGPVELKVLDNVERICSNMGILQPSTYTIRIWGNNTSYLAYQKTLMGTSFPGSTGYVMGPGEMGLLNGSNLDENAEHEFAHSMSLHVNGSFGNNPRWFWETVAIYESGEFRDPTTISYLKNNNFPTIAELDNGFNTGSRQIYEVGYLIGEFIVSKWGNNKLVELIKKNGNTQNVCGLSQVEFGTKWTEFVKDKYLKSSAIKTSDQGSVKIYPNPANNYVSFENSCSKDLRIMVFNEMGRLVLESFPENNITDISSLKKGIYLINIIDPEKSSTFRLLKD